MVTGFCNALGSPGIWGIAWDGWAALATVAAVVVALVVPRKAQKQEWAEQARRHAEEAEDRANRRRDVIHEVCSAADQVVAYRLAMIAISEQNPAYVQAPTAAKRIASNLLTLEELLSVLVVRPELSDGSVFLAIAAKRLARQIFEPTSLSASVGWEEVKRRLAASEIDAAIVRHRSEVIRAHFNLGASRAASSISTKYDALAEEFRRARHTNDTPATLPLEEDRY